MKGLQYYGSGDSIQGSFKYVSHTNLAIAGTAATTSALNSQYIWLSLGVAAHVKIGSGSATTSDFVMPPGLWPMMVDRGDTISLIQLAGGSAGTGSVIIAEE